MVRDTVRALWAEPRPSHAPGRVWRDWALVGVLVPWSVLEGLLREDLARRPVAVAVGLEPAALEAALSWIEESRRTWSDRMDRLETHLARSQERENQ